MTTAQSRGPMLARQASALDGYHCLVEDAAGRPVGEGLWPALAQARNARVRWHGQDGRGQGEVRIICGKRDGRVSFEYLDRGWVNDVRYRLLDGAITLAVAELRFTPGKVSRRELRLLEPLTARLLPDCGPTAAGCSGATCCRPRTAASSAASRTVPG